MRETIVARLVNACWYVFKLAVAVVLLGGVGTGVYMYVRMDDEIRRHVEAFLQQRYPQLTVAVSGARIVENKGIAVYGVTISDPAAAPGNDQMLAVEELMLMCDVKLTSLVQGTPSVRLVEVKHPRVTAHRDRTGRWNLAALIPATPTLINPPQIVIRNGALSISDEFAGQSQGVALNEIHVNITPTPASENGGFVGFRVDGTLGGVQAKRIEIHASTSAPNWHGSGSIEVEQFQVGEPLVAWVRSLLPPWLQSVRVSGRVDGKVALQWTGFQGPPQVRGALVLSDGRVEDPRLPAPLTELTGQLIVENDLQQVKELQGKCGGATVAASVNRTGWALRAPIALSARADNVALDNALYRSLAGAQAEGLAVAGVLREQWDKFSPAGVVDATLQATFDGLSWRPAAALTGRGLSFESEKFPYRLTDGSGTIKCLPATGDQPKLVEIDIIGHSRQTPLHIEGRVFDPKPDAAGWVRITGENLEIEKGMLDAIRNTQCREVIGQLHPSGRFNVAWQLERTAPGAEPQTGLQLDLTDVRINYDRFPYPLSNIRGTISARGDQWTFSDLTSGGRRSIRGGGFLRPMTAGGVELSLWFDGEKVPLDPDLYDALAPTSGGDSGPASSDPGGAQLAWTQLNPRGQIDLHVDVLYHTGQPKPQIGVVIRPRESTQIRPAFFPYLMEQVSGTISYKDGHIELDGLRAHNDLTTITTNGSGDFWPEGNWQFELRGLAADNISAGPELMSALPRQLGKLVERLRPTGNFTVHNGVLSFRKSASEIAPLETEWDIEIDCHQTDLQCGIDLKYINGSVRLKGSSDGVRSYSAGELALESVTFQDVQFTNVTGPMWVNESKCLLGSWATDQQQQPKRSLTGNVYDGTLGANAWVTFDNLPQYQAEVHVVGADLRRLVVERFGGQRTFTGKVDADLMLGGSGYKLESLVGEGDAHIRDANLYELSLLASLLKMVRTGAADKTAFTQSEIAFRMQGKHIVLDQIDFLGDIVNLKGHGDTDFDQNLQLVFSAEVARHDYQIPFVKSIVQETNRQILQMYVNGTLSEPQVTTEALPGLSHMFQQLSADVRHPIDAAEQRNEQRRRLAAQQQQTR